MNKSKKIIILHDDPLKRSRLKQLATEGGYTAFCFEKIAICLDNLNSLSPDLIFIGSFPLTLTARFVNFVKTVDPGLPLILMGADDLVRDFIASNKFAEITFVKKELNKQAFIRKMNELPISPRLAEQVNSSLMVGNSPEIMRLRKLCSEISRSKEAILIQGESGTGKDLVAKTLHRWSCRQGLPLIKLNVRALSAHHYIESDPSGKKIETTDAELDAIDKILNDKFRGTLFLDGIEYLSPPFQARLASFIIADSKRDARESRRGIIASAGIDLETIMQNSHFSKDLLFRLSVFKIEIPPLRKHPKDIPLLIDYLADMYCLKLSNGICEISEDAKRLFQEYSWPGNIKELENAVKKFIDSGFDIKTIEHLARQSGIDNPNPTAVFETGIADLNRSLNDNNAISMKGICKQIVTKTERKLIKEALRHHNWNRKKAARMLDISYRSLLNKIKEYRLV